MPETNPTTESVFWKALAIPSAGEPAQYLDQACGGDAALRAQIEELLAAYPKVERFREKPAAAAGVTSDVAADRWIDPVNPPRLTEGPGTRIGPYKLLQQVGEGAWASSTWPSRSGPSTPRSR